MCQWKPITIWNSSRIASWAAKPEHTNNTHLQYTISTPNKNPIQNFKKNTDPFVWMLRKSRKWKEKQNFKPIFYSEVMRYVKLSITLPKGQMGIQKT